MFFSYYIRCKIYRMPRLTRVVSIVLMCVFFNSCQKEVTGELPTEPETPTGDIMGNYKFVSLTQTSNVTQQVKNGTDIEQVVTVATFTSTNNTGTLRINSHTMSTTNIAYTANMLARVYRYSNGALLDSTDMPFQFNMPSSSSTTSYKRIGTDSVYFSSGNILMSDVMQPTQPIGARLKVEGDKLYIMQNADLSTTQNTQGTTIITLSKATAVITLQRL